MTVCLAVTCHDPSGRFEPGVRAAGKTLSTAFAAVAMNTTAFGLLVAIPLLVVHHVLNTKTAQIVAGLEMASVKMLNAIHSAVKRQFQVAA